ncbi:TonB-dependent receptor [Fulvivirga sp.]|uniref:SusC/RagA family TonB-linked outer membrane protein n=1 Tax=Fulvivirga sp. TaxID=1931237 RepID=UPI0032ECDBBF
MIKSKYLLGLVFYFIAGNIFGQGLIVNGTVTSNDGALPGVNVVVEGTSLGTVTDIDGNYSIQLEEPNMTLIFSFIGYKTQSVAVNGRSEVNVRLEEDVSQLEEVVVIGYGSVRKSDLTGSVTSIKSEELIKSPAADPVQSLQGKVAGLQILSGSGTPGSESYVRLRGINTLNDNRVLYVVDGVIVDGGINFLNNQDIASIEVLKDASAKAIFGTRGANGVIIVTTKKGTGDAKISFAAEYGVEKVANKLDLMSGPEFARYINDVTPGTYNNISVLPDTDWQDLVFEDWQPIQTYTLSVSGATEKLNYYLSGGLFQQEGIIPKSDFQRANLKLNTSYKVRDYLKIGTSMTGILRNTTNAPGVVSPAYWAWPINAPFNADGSFGEVQGSGNPLAAIEYSNSETKAFRIVGNVYTELTFLKDFTFKTSYQFDIGNDKTRSFTPVYYVSPTQQNEENDLKVEFGENRSWIFENTLAYNKETGVHRIDAVIGYSAQENNSEFLTGTRENLLGESEDLWYLNAGSTVNQQNTNGASVRALSSILFRANYVYDDRYLFTATFRRDGSSSFGANNRYGNFPAFALGWNLSNEAFFPAGIPLEKLKLRASWGINGNQNIPFLDQYSVIGAGIDAVFGQNEAINSGATFSGRPGNSDLKWEETSEFDIGVEFGLLEGRLSGEIDYYNRLTSDILVLLDLPGYAGAGAFVQKRFNAADVRNSGFDFVLNWQDEVGQVSYGFGVTGNTVKNEVEGLGEGIPGAGTQIISGDLGNGQRVTITEKGQSIGSFYGYKVIGVFQDADQLASTPRLSQQGIGDFIYADTDGNGVLNADDRTIIGSWIPDFVYGFNANVGFKGLSLSLDFAGQSGNEIYNGKQAIRFATLNYEDRFNERWTGPGTSNTDPKASTGGINYNPSDYFIEDASFIKLRTVTISYALPNPLIEKLKILTASVYVRGTNLWNSTDYSGYTPELGGSDSAIGGIIDLGVYPTTKVISAGLNLTF